MEPLISIVALDLDGTLLDSEKRLSALNRDALADVAARGALIVPTTGRFFGMMPAEIRDLAFVRYAITVNGAQVYDRERDEAIVREEIALPTALAVMELLDGFDVIYDCYRQNWGWITAALQNRAADYATNDHYLRMMRTFRNPVPELKAHLMATAAEGDVQKIMLFAPKADPDAAAKTLAAIRAAISARFPEITVTSSTWNNLELNSHSAHKGVALRRFAEHFGLGLENCMAFGDGLNDKTMIQAAGCGIAMANAHPEVREVARYVTDSNDSNGVAHALKRFADRFGSVTECARKGRWSSAEKGT